MRKLLMIFVAALLLSQTMAQNTNESAASKQNDARMQWWKDAKFGMFIHWGLYAEAARHE